MERRTAEQLITELYLHVLGRAAGPVEYDNWVAEAIARDDPASVVRDFYGSSEYKQKNLGVTSTWATGHYHSPVVDPRTVEPYFRKEHRNTADDLKGITLNARSMHDIWTKNLELVRSTPFTEAQTPENRYYYQSGSYPYGDAIVLRMMIGHFRPKRVIEIGSGTTSACMLDSIGHVGHTDFNLTCIEPYPERFRTFLRPGDEDKITIIEKPVQDVPVDIVDSLEENDILFIDSTHVLKTGSDVHHELFYLLPRLKPGVVVHFHDVQYPFEYPEKWVFDFNYSWNEAYALRAFLMYNQAFEVIFWNSYFAGQFTQEIREVIPVYLKNGGGSIWLRKLAWPVASVPAVAAAETRKRKKTARNS